MPAFLCLLGLLVDSLVRSAHEAWGFGAVGEADGGKGAFVARSLASNGFECYLKNPASKFKSGKSASVD
ncbi:hypothetical protein [Deefgea piscis]|uniref:hypothetical protein n=1 Tax=Deefgea piscis TaxID=2739061 RepID=UPI001C81E9F5|nr:hypothetical protein [Deefgea piscis]QZA80171.1 hypothetical protein K4H25_11570 [Deefgea piscis]